MSDIKKMYKTIMSDHFPNDLIIRFGDQTLVYRKRTWKIPDEKSRELIEILNRRQRSMSWSTGTWSLVPVSLFSQGADLSVAYLKEI
jgi:hypothetical protein